MKVVAPNGLAGGGQPGKRVVEVVELVDVVVVLVDVVVGSVAVVVVVVVAPGSVVVVETTGGTQGFTVAQSSPIPGIAAAPGPGRLPVASTVGSKVGGIPKTLTRVKGTGPPSNPSSGDPIAVIVFTAPPPGPNAPWSRWAHVSNGSAHGGPTACPFSQHLCAGSAKLKESLWSRQKPAKTRSCPGSVSVSFVAEVAVHEIVPVDSANPIGSAPRLSDGSGGQSWLVG
jgi:hypothetical protein